jgi:MFS family permease
MIKFILASAIVAFGAGMIVPLMTRWLDRRYGVSDAISGPILGVANIIIGVATLAAPPLARKIGLVKAIVVTQGLSTLFMFLTPLQPEYLSASFVYTVRAFLMNMASPLQQSMDGDFDTGNVRYKTRERYSFGWSDPLGVYGSPGSF